MSINSNQVIKHSFCEADSNIRSRLDEDEEELKDKVGEDNDNNDFLTNIHGKNRK